MGKSSELDILAELEGLAPHGASAYGDAPIVILQYGAAGNDATCEDPVATAGIAYSARPTNYELHKAARAHRSSILGEMIIAALRAAAGFARRAHTRYCRRRDARAVYHALRHLDDRTLRDLGFDRSEMTSVAAEVAGTAERTRIRTLLGN